MPAKIVAARSAASLGRVPESISSGYMHAASTWRKKVKGFWPTDCGLPMLQRMISSKGRSADPSASCFW